jgi:hypothetical protein
MKVVIEAIIDLGDSYIDTDSLEELIWAKSTVENSVSIRVGDDVCDDFPIRVVSFGAFYD